MEPFRLRIKIGEHEFEAEGEQESVERQFALWRDLVSAAPAAPPVLPSPPPVPGALAVPQPERSTTEKPAGYDKIFRHSGPVVSLSVIPNGETREADAALLLLLGYRAYAGDDQVTGGRLLQGLEQSGVRVGRADRVFGDYMEDYVIRSGQHRAVRYRLTNSGMQKAQQLAEELMQRVP